jgi:hypothetical protein
MQIPHLIPFIEARSHAGGSASRGAAAALAICASLRGPEIVLLDLTGLWKYIDLGKDGVLPQDPLKTGVGLS